MITFLWMLFLAFTILATLFNIVLFVHNKEDKNGYSETMQSAILTSLLWSIWYFYFLH